MRKNLVTGGAGFLGSHLCEALLARGEAVVCVDNLFTGSRENLARCVQNPAFTFVEQDVTQPLEFDVERIFHMACPASPVHYQHDPVKTVRTCVIGSLNVMELAKSRKARIFSASTSEVYGDPEEHPQREGYWGHVNPIGLRSCYDEGKRCAETLFFDYHRQYEVDIRVGRIFNTYGPHMHPDDGRVVSNFILQALRGDDITLYGDGAQTRSFCYVDDLIDVILRMMNSDDCGPGPINIGNPQEMTVKELAERVLALTQSRSKLAFKPLPSDDPVRRRPDITLAKQRLGWQPAMPLEEGLSRTIAYFRRLAGKG